VHIVATETRHAAAVRHTLDEIIALHPVFVSRSIGKMHEVGLTKPVFLEPPEILQVQALMKIDRPVVVQTVDRIVERLALRMTLNAGIRRADKVELRRVRNIRTARICRLLGMGIPESKELPGVEEEDGNS
jgi:hypothetical protein